MYVFIMLYLKLTNLCRFDEWQLSATIEVLLGNNTSTFDVKISAFFRSQSLVFWVFSVFKTAV